MGGDLGDGLYALAQPDDRQMLGTETDLAA